MAFPLTGSGTKPFSETLCPCKFKCYLLNKHIGAFHMKAIFQRDSQTCLDDVCSLSVVLVTKFSSKYMK